MATTPPARSTGVLRSIASGLRRWLTGRSAYPGDFTGPLAPSYSPKPDGRPDPGEIVWTWVPFEEDHTQGKDRPVLVVGRDGRWLLALQLTSKDHDGYPATRRPAPLGRHRVRRLGPPAPPERGAGRPRHPGRPQGRAARGRRARPAPGSTTSPGPSPTCTADGGALGPDTNDGARHRNR